MKKFEIGKRYEMRSICDHNCVWAYTIKARTESTIILVDDKGKETKCRINKRLSEYHHSESAKPLGTYSMSPTLIA